MTRHQKGCSDERCAEAYCVPPGEAKFFCQGCERWNGWCKGAEGDMPELCDDCWYHVTIWRDLAAKEQRSA